MEQFYYPPQVSVIPDAEERKQIRKRYNLIALVILADMLIFNGGARLVKFIVTAACGSEIWKNELLREIFSSGMPCIAEMAAIILGILIFRVEFLPLTTREGYGGGTVLKLIVTAFGLQGFAAVIVSIVSFILGLVGLKGTTPDFSITTSLPANLMMALYTCLIAPVLEELFYRGVLLQTLRRYNERFAIILSALIFGLMHQNYQQFVLAFLVGIPLAAVTVKYGSIVPAVMTHIMLNTVSTLENCLIQYTCPEVYSSVAEGKLFFDTSSLSPSGMAVLALNAVFRYGTMAAALVIIIIALVKGGNMSRPTPAGKARTMPVFVTAALWWIVFAAYLFLTFIYPFIRK